VWSDRKYGSGVERIKNLFTAYGLKEPKFEEQQKGFKVTVYKETTQETTNKSSTKEKYYS